MKRAVNGIIFLLLALNGPGHIPAQENPLYDWSDSLRQFETVSSLILENPLSPELKEYTRLVILLMPAVGRNSIYRLLDAALKQLESAGASGSTSWLILASAVIEAGYPERLKDSGVFPAYWRLSGAWNRYGEADMDYPFQPELSNDWKKLRVKKISAGSNGFHPCSMISGGSGIVYARCMFSVNSGVRIAVLSDAVCRIFINGKDYGMIREFSGRYSAAFRLTGSQGYSVMLKFMADGNSMPAASLFVAGEKGSLPGFRLTESARMTPATVEDLLIDYKAISADGGKDLLSVRQLVSEYDYRAALDLCEDLVKKNPCNYFIYREYLSLLDLMQRDREFLRAYESFINTFPESDIARYWLAGFYSTRDRLKFTESMAASDQFYAQYYMASNYIHAVAADGDHDRAVSEAERFIRSMPEKYLAIAGACSVSGRRDDMRKLLVHGAAETGDARIFYMLGCADEAAGLDPIIYWTKALESIDLFCEASDMIDFYENSNPGTNIYYTGKYSIVREEFRNNGLRRRIKIRIFESGKVYVQFEDFIPAAIIQARGGDSFNFLFPAIEDVRLLYVLKINDLLSEPAEYKEFMKGRRAGVEIKNCADCRYAVVKYSYCFESTGKVERVIASLPAVMKDEYVEDLRISAIYTGTGKPALFVNNSSVRGRERINESLFSWNDTFSRPAAETLTISINRWRSPADFASWYAGLASIRSRFSENTPFVFPEYADTVSALDYVRREALSLTEDYDNNGLVPRAPDSVMRLKSASTVEKAFLALAMLDRAGIKGNIAFGLSSDGLSIDENEVLIYVPVNREECLWLPVSGKLSGRDRESERMAVVVQENGGRVIPVQPDRVIKE